MNLRHTEKTEFLSHSGQHQNAAKKKAIFRFIK